MKANEGIISLYGCFQKYGKTPKSSILIGFGTIINHPFWDTTIFGNIHISLVKHSICKMDMQHFLFFDGGDWGMERFP